uniref:Transcriptional corepressor LEUNIG_HOMOLOG-like isoform X1 n=2 Tax=Nicotiana tabacum TaxID=4097 RepID=A0A1S4ALG8_TOBAC|nr:PREDICTED: transcriptional corepressor LEUNIG_HOMOLOG-like isoform X1 [Nicotiana tabacum]XP_016477572.1 PREDICTED: transcriptional corepressor LEUNIG_HOMOLOG-like isoform X1 [Nicotiana tabacum]
MLPFVQVYMSGRCLDLASSLLYRGGSAQVRFQPITGHQLAAASDKVVSIFDVENDRQLQSFQGHSGVVNYLCWDLNGDLLASVSEESVKVWSLTTGDCIHENQFHSCVFHPSCSALLVIGGMRVIIVFFCQFYFYHFCKMSI